MPSIREIKTSISTNKELHVILESYEEIAAMRMRKVKKFVLQNRDYLSGISDVYAYVRTAYSTFLEKLTGHPAVNNTAVTNNGKTVLVFLSSNVSLYGEIIEKTFSLFAVDAANSSGDLVIVGKLGRVLYSGLQNKREFRYFDLPDSNYSEEMLVDLVNYVLQYRTIYVYHGIFENMLSQIPVRTNVTGDVATFNKTQSQDPNAQNWAIFEPSVKEVAQFFESQLLRILFEQTINESSLSKYASRMVSLDFAVSRVSKSTKDDALLLQKYRHRLQDKAQQATLTGLNCLGY